MSEIHGAVGSYVINALDSPETREFEAHLAVCETCRREVVEFSETAAQLGHLVEAPPPPALRASILSAIREVRPLPPVEVRETSEPEFLPRRMNVAPTSRDDASVARQVAPVDELAVRRSRRMTRVLAFAAAAALVIALGLGGWVVNLRHNQAQVASGALEAQLLAAPDLKVVTTPMKNGGVASFRYSRSLDKAMFVGEGLTAPEQGKAYQLWTIKGPAAVPDRLFAGGQAQKAWLDGDIQDADGAAVTLEPSGGSKTPTAPILASVNL